MGFQLSAVKPYGNCRGSSGTVKQYDIHASGGISHHLAISDAAGRSVSVEFVDGEIREALQQVSQTEGEWRTQWSIVYSQDTQMIDYYFGGVYQDGVLLPVSE